LTENILRLFSPDARNYANVTVCLATTYKQLAAGTYIYG